MMLLNMKKFSTRNSIFDQPKGIGILSVLIYHILPHTLGYDSKLNIIYSILDQYQIPLFLFQVIFSLYLIKRLTHLS